MPADLRDPDLLAINTIRTLSMDAVQAANSGHPGTPMALAPVAYCLWQHFLRFDPEDPIWPNRDRFVLSTGHASMLLYSLLHLTGVKAVNPKYERLGEPSVTLDDIKHFRQLDSKCPGHPEYRWTSGVETTTGPLGQGVATSVGMAIAGRWLAAYFNRPGFELFDFDVYALCGDGDMMEGHLRRGGLARRAPQALQPLLDLRQQPHHHRGPHRPGLQRGRRHALHRLRLERDPRRRRQRPRHAAPRASSVFKNTTTGPTLIIVDSHIAYGAPTQAGHRRRPRRAARRGGDPAHQAVLRLAGGRQVPGPRRRLRALPRRASASAGSELREAWLARFEEYQAAVSRAGRPARPDAAPPAARRLGQGPARPSPPTPRAWPAATRRARC